MGEKGPRPPLPYTRHTLTEADEHAVLAALRSGCIAQGPVVRAFEAELADSVGTEFAVAVSNGTVALELALAALGVGPGDQVIVPSLTFVATANAVCRRGGIPVFADVDDDTLNLSPVSVAKLLNERTAGVIPVHFAGHPADVPALREVVGPELFVLEDAAHALGAFLGDEPAGALGDAACFSFHPAKLITSGEGGAVATDSGFLARRLQSFREHGLERDPAHFEGLGFPEDREADAFGPWVYEQQLCGTNARLSEPSAALVKSQLGRAQALLARRRELACLYDRLLADLPGLRRPTERDGAQSAWHLYTIRLETERIAGGRRAIYEGMRASGILVQVHYIPVHLQPYHRHSQGTRHGDCPVAEEAYLRSLSLPLFPDMRDEDVERVVDTLRRLLR